MRTQGVLSPACGTQPPSELPLTFTAVFSPSNDETVIWLSVMIPFSIPSEVDADVDIDAQLSSLSPSSDSSADGDTVAGGDVIK
jgi:hypothetical protein